MGKVDSWKECCPLRGRCSECGLEIEWRDLLSPLRVVPRWSFEHASTRRVRAFFGTVSRAVLPWRLTRSLKLHHPFRLGRLVLLVGCMFLMVYLSVMLTALPIAGRYLIWSLQHPTKSTFTVSEAARFIAWPYQNYPDVENVLLEVISFAAFVASWALVMAVIFPLVAVTIRKHRVSPRHFVRMGVYCVVGVMAFAVLGQMILSIPGFNDLLAYFTGLYFQAANDWPRKIMAYLLLASVPWMVIYWWCAYRFYMRLPHALVMSILLNLIGLMVGSTLLLFLTGAFR